MKTILIAALLLLSAGVSRADSVWTYTGQSTNLYSMDPFAAPAANPCGCSLQASVDVTDAGTIASWSFTAGALTLTNLDSTLVGFLGPAQPGYGLPEYWSLYVFGAGGDIFTRWSGSINDALDTGGNLSVGSNPGFWTDPPVSTPEPSTLVLLGAGLVGLLLRKRTKPAITATWERLA